MRTTGPNPQRAVFLDRDGVIIEDRNFLTEASQIRIIPGAPKALHQLRDAGFRLFVISNQAVVARGMATESEVEQINLEINRQLTAAGGVGIEQYYFCPHHPNADVQAYRVDCDCRKPKSGLLLRAAKEHGLDLQRSFFVGDRMTDIIAGARAGCRTILVHTGKHKDPQIQTSEPIDTSIKPDQECADLAAAADWILKAT